jgi:hypothetical protein
MMLEHKYRDMTKLQIDCISINSNEIALYGVNPISPISLIYPLLSLNLLMVFEIYLELFHVFLLPQIISHQIVTPKV